MRHVITIFASHIILANAIANEQCHHYFSYHIHVSGASVLGNVTVVKDVNPQNPNVTATPNNANPNDKNSDFTISEDSKSCENDHEGQSTVFRVIIGSELSPPIKDKQDNILLDADGKPVLNINNSRAGRNCILTLIAGPNQNLELYPNILGGVYCTDNIQLDLKDKNNPLKLDMNTGRGEYNKWNPHLWPPFVGLGDTKVAYDYDYYYPTFSTPKN